MVGGSGGDRDDGSLGGRIHREYRGGGRGSGRYRRGLTHHRHIIPGERRGVLEQGHSREDETKADPEKIDIVKHRPHKGEFVLLFCTLLISSKEFIINAISC